MAAATEHLDRVPDLSHDGSKDNSNVDPFLTSSTSSSGHLRFSTFDSQVFALGAQSSPEQAKRALEAHLAETERRIQEASKLGTTLIEQRSELADRLQEVEKQQAEGDISPELRQKLLDIEREYNEVGRESARAFLPKSRVVSTEAGMNSPMRSASPTKFESQAMASPTKLSVPNRKQRNQQSNRVHDIEFATEISTSLLSQVRNLQTLLAEKEESLRAISLDKSRLEAEAEGFNQRLRSLDESENRYKDENWNLETQIHEHIAQSKDAADREQRLTQALNVIQAEKAAAQKELDDTKLSHAKLAEDHSATIKHHDTELGSVKRNLAMIETERGALQRKVEELMGQNQELAMAVAQHRGRQDDSHQSRELTDDDFVTADDNGTPEHSPPPSPTKGTPRHSGLESETLKSSLGHAHRMIQSLKGNIHREKTEKLELKRLLQDARDELEAKRNDPLLGSGPRKSRKTDSKEFKKPLKPGQLGGQRSSRSEVYMDDPDWEENNVQSPSQSPAVIAARAAAGFGAGGIAAAATREVDSSTDHFETANETSDAFETADERRTETDDFHTGAEEMSGEDELTETEDGPAIRRPNRPSALNLAGNRHSFQSTASDDDLAYEDMRTPMQAQTQRMRLKVGRGSMRRSRFESEEAEFTSSPPVFVDSNNSTPQIAGQSLFSELGNLEASDEEESFIDATPSKRSIAAPLGVNVNGSPYVSTPTKSAPISSSTVSEPVDMAGTMPSATRSQMVDTGTMTDDWEPIPAIMPEHAHVSEIASAGLAGAGLAGAAALLRDKHASTASSIPSMSDAASQWHEEQFNKLLSVDNGNQRPLSTSTYSDMGSQHEDIDEKLARFPSPPISPQHKAIPSTSSLNALAAPLTMSAISSEHVEPRQLTSTRTMEPLSLSGIASEQIEPLNAPVEPTTSAPITQLEIPRPVTPVQEPLAFSFIQSVDTEPIAPWRSPKRDGVILPRDDSDEFSEKENEQPATPKAGILGAGILGTALGWATGKAATSSPIIAEDETRQSPSDPPAFSTPDLQRPLRDVSGNANEKPLVKEKLQTSDVSSQTMLSAAEIDGMLKSKSTTPRVIVGENLVSPPTSPSRTPLRTRKSQESFGSVGRARARMAEPDFVHDASVLKRPGSAGSNITTISVAHPPLPSDHKQVIAAASQRGTSSSTAQTSAPGSMGPPLMPASAYKSNPSFRPRTPGQSSVQTPASPGSMRGSVNSRSGQQIGSASIYAPISGIGISRQSSVSSFASEVDTRFNLRNGMPLPHGFENGTDPRMIQAITQTMIGEYLWKYTRKAGRGEMSDNRHRRYFWVHPYTRTLYWSDRDPSQAGRAELKAKSVAIEAVRVVTDDNPMPPGLHRKSLIILTPGRAVKFTATTGQRHETWFNALSYLLLRTEDGGPDSENVATGALTREDVEEFNPQYGTRQSRNGPASLSSYNSRTTRNESPARLGARMSMQQPTLNPMSGRQSPSTFSRLSNMWKPKDNVAGSFASRRSRTSLNRIGGNGSIYEASEVHDSAEDLREMIERQDRESDKLENVRACCDGKHDVGQLSHTSKKGRHSHSHSHSNTHSPIAGSSQRLRNSQSVQQIAE